MRRQSLVVALAAIISLLMPVASASAATVRHDACGFEDRMPRIVDPAAPDFKRPAYHSDCPDYKGWGHAKNIGPGSCIWMGCKIAIFNTPVPAYRWSNGAWVRHDIPNDDWVYVWPFGNGWSWAWHYNTRSWHAMKSDSITIHPTQFAY